MFKERERGCKWAQVGDMEAAVTTGVPRVKKKHPEGGIQFHKQQMSRRHSVSKTTLPAPRAHWVEGTGVYGRRTSRQTRLVASHVPEHCTCPACMSSSCIGAAGRPRGLTRARTCIQHVPPLGSQVSLCLFLDSLYVKLPEPIASLSGDIRTLSFAT
jgi:hypothetical protein